MPNLDLNLLVALYALLQERSVRQAAQRLGLTQPTLSGTLARLRRADVNVEVGIVMPLESLLDPEAGGSAEIVGHGLILAGIVRDLLASTEGKRWWRRLFTACADGPLVGGDPRRRRFDGVLAHLIGLRDGGRCRDPFCDAPIRHFDHIDRRRAGGPTRFTDGRGVHAHGNYAREVPDWQVEVIDDGARATTAHGADHHPHRPHLPQHRRTAIASLVLATTARPAPGRNGEDRR